MNNNNFYNFKENLRINKGMNSIKRSYYSTIARDNICVEIRDEKKLVINKFNSISSWVKFYGLSLNTLDIGLLMMWKLLLKINLTILV